MSFCPTIFLLRRSLFRFPAYFSTGLFVFLLFSFMNCLYNLEIKLIYVCIYFLPFGRWSFYFFMASFAVQRTSLVAQTIKRLPTMWETWVQSLGWEDHLKKEMATHSSTLAWRIPWMEEPLGGSKESVGHD